MNKNSSISTQIYKQIYNSQNNKFLSTQKIFSETNYLQNIKTEQETIPTDFDHTLFNNTLHISEQIRLVKQQKKEQEQQSLTDRRSKRSEERRPFNSTQKLPTSFNKASKHIHTHKNSLESLNEFIQDSLLKKLSRDKFVADTQKEKLSLKNVREDLSHIYDQPKNHQRIEITSKKTSLDIISQKVIQSNKKLSTINKHQVTNFTKAFQLINIDDYNIKSQSKISDSNPVTPRVVLTSHIKEFENDLRSTVNCAAHEAPGSRVQAIRLLEWFNKNKTSQITFETLSDKEFRSKVISIISVTFSELARQVKIDCNERGILMEEIWVYLNDYLTLVQDHLMINMEKHSITSIEEFNRIHEYYRQKHINDGIEKDIQTQFYQKEYKEHQQTLKELKYTEQQLHKTRNQLSDYRKIALFLKRRTEQLKEEVDKLLVIKEYKHKPLNHQDASSSAASSPKLRKSNAASHHFFKEIISPKQIEEEEKIEQKKEQIFSKIPEAQSQVSSPMKKLIEINHRKDSESEDDEGNNSANNLLGGLLDEKNIVELNNMVMNMDKIIQVRDFAQQIDNDFQRLISKDTQTQSNLSFMNPDYYLIMQNQQQIDNFLENFKLKMQVEDSLKQIEDRLTKASNAGRQFSILVEQKFFNRSDKLIDEKENSKSINPSIQQSYNSDSIKEESKENEQSSEWKSDFDAESSSKGATNLHSPIIQQEVEKVKALIQLLKTTEYKLHTNEKQVEELQNQLKKSRTKNEEVEQLNDQLNIEINYLKTKMQSMKAVDSDKIVQLEEEKNDEKAHFKKKAIDKYAQKQQNQAKMMMFKGPQLGQKVTVTYDFQKANIGMQIVEKVKLKQVQKIKNFMPIKLLIKQISLIYQEKIAQQKENSQIKEQEMASYVYTYFLNQFGIPKIAEQKFLILVLSVKHHRSIIRVNVFAKFMSLFDVGINYNIDEQKKYLEALDFVINVSQLGTQIPDNDSEMKFYIPYIRAIQYIGQFVDTRMTYEEKEELKKEMELLKENDPRNVNKAGIIDFDQFMMQLFVKYKILVSRAKEYVINAFAACDLDGNGMCNFEEFYLLIRHIEPDRLSPEQVSEIFFANADLFVEGEQNFSFEKFAVVCVEHNLFSDESQNIFINSKGTRNELLTSFQRLSETWINERSKIEEVFDQIKILPSEKLDHWREIIQTLENKIYELKDHIQTPGMEKKIKPLLIAFILLQKETKLLLELQQEQEELQNSQSSNDEIQQ